MGPVGFGFHGGYVPTSQKKSFVKKPVDSGGDKKLSAEQECKILVSALARQLLASQDDKIPGSESEEENVAPEKPSPFPSKQSKWSTPTSKFSGGIRPKKKQGLDLIEIGLQMGKSKVFLRQHAFEALERMRGVIKAEAATVINSLIRMYLRRKRFIIMRNEYRAILAERSRMIQEANGQKVTTSRPEYIPEVHDQNVIPESPARMQFQNMEISLHCEPDNQSVKDFKWVWMD